MFRYRRLSFLLFFCAVAGAGQNVPNPRALYDAHQWFQLRDTLMSNQASNLYQGAVAAAFDHRKKAEKLLYSVIHDVPKSPDADDARQWLGYLYFRAGRYPRALKIANESLVVHPDDNNAKSFRALLSSFPQAQKTVELRSSKVRFRMTNGNLAIPVSVNGNIGTYIADSDMNISMLSESEAKRLGLKVGFAGAGSIGMTGAIGEASGNYKVAVADELVVGKVRLNHVAFIIMPDNGQPFANLPPGQRGILGLPVLLAFRTLRWTSDGTFEIAFQPKNEAAHAASLCFDGSDPIVQGKVANHQLNFVFDMGSVSTDFWRGFAKDFSNLLAKSGQKSSWHLNGIDGSKSVQSAVLPEVELQIGEFKAVERPAHVLLEQTTSNDQWFQGRVGMDTLNQAHRVTVDFKSMTVLLE